MEHIKKRSPLNGQLTSNGLWRTDKRDIIAYMWALFWLGRCFYNGRIRLFDAVGFLVLYVLYVIFVFLQDKFLIEEPEIGKVYEHGLWRNYDNE